VRLISMAMTGYYRTMQRPRVHQPLSMLKYDPIGTFVSAWEGGAVL
jgi:large subunit ribosomal protein L33